MSSFSFRARDAEGGVVAGTSEAPSAAAVAAQLAERGLIPVHIEALPERPEWLDQLRAALPRRRRRVGIDDQILFCRQMQTLSAAGVPLIRALHGLAETVRSPAMVTALTEVIADLEGGRPLAAAVGRHGEAFPPIVCSMIRIGEATGRLDTVFAQCAAYLEQEKETANRIKAALRYPLLVIVAIAVALTFVTLFVIPTFARTYRGLGAALPWATRLLIAVSHFAQQAWPYLLIGAVVAFFVGRNYLRSPEGQVRWGELKLKIPVVGGLVWRATMARFARAFAMTFGAGVPLMQSLAVTARAVDNAYVAGRIEQMAEGIGRGDSLTRTAAATGMMTPLVLQMLAVGEETGEVDVMLGNVADYYEREVDYDLRNLTSIIEPVLILAIGAIVLVLALGVFLPMWDLSRAVRGG